MGRQQTPETRAKIAAALKGRKLSPEHREHVRQALLSRDPAVYEKIAASVRRHGHASSRTYHSWHMMKQRCTNPKATGYAEYGGRGIAMCERWQSFDNFLVDMGERPAGMSLDRIDVDGNYEPNNCRWATITVQNFNRRPWRASA